MRALIATTLADLGLEGSQSLAEVVLLRDGHHVGWRFECDGFRAVWLLDTGQIRFLDQDGKMIGVVSIADGAASRAA